jgi:serine/threonine-protein kinase
MTSESSRSKGPVSTNLTVVPGDTIGKFRVESIVGRGGMGVVVEATNIQLDQRVAIKVLAGGTNDPAMVERFSGEARAAARLKSEHVARVYDVGTDARYGPFIVMEMLEGKTLAEVVKAHGRVQYHRAVEYIIDACEGLAEAHARDIVHQDVKPANLFLVKGADGRPSIKLLDFGIATVRTMKKDGANPDAKSSHPSTGTPAYLAPEQLRASAPIDHRADIWALGCVLYELLVGERAFRATRFTELVTAILEAPPHPFPTDLDVPPGVLAAVLRCLERDPNKRFTSTGALALALLPYARPRAHQAAHRAVSHVKTRGLDPDLEMPMSMPPRAVELYVESASSAALRAPGVPAYSVAASPPSAAAAAATPVSAPAPAASSPSASAAPAARTTMVSGPVAPARRPFVILIALGALFAIGVAILAWRLFAGAGTSQGAELRAPGAASASPSASASTTTSTTPSTSPSPSPSASPSASTSAMPSAGELPRLETPPMASAQAPKPAVVRPPRSGPAPHARPAPAASDSEIRYTR